MTIAAHWLNGSQTPTSATSWRGYVPTPDRIPKFLLPSVRHNLAHGGPIERSALVIAAWARYAEGVDDAGQLIEVVDPLREQLMAAAARQAEEPTAFLAQREIFGDLVDDPRFTDAYLRALASLHTVGALATVEVSMTTPFGPTLMGGF